MGHSTPKHFGFTLMELLVVLGILGLLTAMLFPVFARAREKGRQTVCLSNERQLGMAFLMYTHDNDGFCVRPDGWAFYIYPYVKSVEVFHCPSDPTTAQPPYYPISYGMNANLSARLFRLPLNPKVIAIPVSDISNKTVLLFEVVHSSGQITTRGGGWSLTAAPLSCPVEGNGSWLDVTGVTFNNTPFSIDNDVRYATGPMSWSDPTFSTSSYYEGAGRHQDGANFLFADAHAQWLPPGRVSAGDNCWLTGSYSAATGCAANSDDSAFAATFSPR